jgi:glycosyltransferase involved in cell wall biosynthesis
MVGPLRIAHVISTFPPYYSGTGMVCYYNALELARLGHQVTVFTAAHPPGQFVYPNEFEVRRLPVVFRIGNAPLLPGLLGLKDFDIIHLHHPFIFGAELVMAAARARGIPFVLTHHNDLIGDGLRPFLFDSYSAISNPLVLNSARKLIVVSLDHARSSRLAPYFERRRADVVEVPNGVDTMLFRPDVDGTPVRQACSIGADEKVLLFVGALDRAHHFRRVDLLIEAIRELKSENVHLILVGDGDRAEDYRRQAAEIGVDQRVHFLGKVDHAHLPAVYAAADVVVLPSHIQESFGMILIEGMACGKPVIASDLPGARSVVDDGVDGLLVQPGNLGDLVEKTARLLADPNGRAEMGRRGRAKVEAKYAWQAVVPRLASLYREVVH